MNNDSPQHRKETCPFRSDIALNAQSVSNIEESLKKIEQRLEDFMPILDRKTDWKVFTVTLLIITGAIAFSFAQFMALESTISDIKVQLTSVHSDVKVVTEVLKLYQIQK